jgi:hypothetical protein
MLVDSSDYHGLLFDRLADEHHAILAMLDGALLIRDGDLRGQHEAFLRLAHDIRVHARAEEDVVFPTLDGSYELGHHVRQDKAHHRAIEDQLRAMELDLPSGAAWREEMLRLRGLLERNFRDEEEVVFTRAHNVIGDPQSRELLVEYEQQREFVEQHLPH